MTRISLAIAVAIALVAPVARAQVPAAIAADPTPDAANPPRSEILAIPSGSVRLNGLAYLAQGPGPHPTLVIAHGLPGNEKNLDLAQAVRRAGWNAVTFNYRGSWGSPGTFSFPGNIADAQAVLAYLRAPATAARLGVDTKRLVLAGHSMGGWVTALAASKDKALAGAILISAADMGRLPGETDRAALVKDMSENMESLAGVTAESMAADLTAAKALTFASAAPGLARAPLLVLSSDDGLAAHSDPLAAAVTKAGGTVKAVHVATDHSWSGARIRLQTEVIGWLNALR